MNCYCDISTIINNNNKNNNKNNNTNNNNNNFRVELSEGRKYAFSLTARRRQQTVGIEEIVLPKTERTDMVRIVVIGIDGVMMGAFSEIKLFGCYNPRCCVIPQRYEDTTEVCRQRIIIKIGL